MARQQKSGKPKNITNVFVTLLVGAGAVMVMVIIMGKLVALG